MANDHLGHGASVDNPDGLGWMAKKDGWKYVVSDLHTVTSLGKTEFPNVPFILFGHSMGSFMARAYLSHFAGEIDAAIICGTGGPNPLTSIGIFVSRVLKTICGQKHRSKLLNNMAFGQYCSHFKDAKNDKVWLTKDEEIVDCYIKDPYCNFLFTASAFQDLLSVNKYVNEKFWPSTFRNDIPLLVIAGQDDPVGDYGKGVETVYNRLKECKSDVELKLYENDRHEILNELDRVDVFNDIYKWISEHVEL